MKDAPVVNLNRRAFLLVCRLSWGVIQDVDNVFTAHQRLRVPGIDAVRRCGAIGHRAPACCGGWVIVGHLRRLRRHVARKVRHLQLQRVRAISEGRVGVYDTEEPETVA